MWSLSDEPPAAMASSMTVRIAAPSSGGRYGIESKFTRAVRDLCYAVIGKRLKISKGSAFNACKAA